MAETSIEWTDRSINPIRARHRKTGAVGHYCEKISSGCAACYASDLQRRFKMPEFQGKGRRNPFLTSDGTVVVSEDIELFLDREKLAEVMRRKNPCKWFWCDMTDIFGDWVPDEWIDRIIVTMMLSNPGHTHQVLTKRSRRAKKYFQLQGLKSRLASHFPFDPFDEKQVAFGSNGFSTPIPWPIPNLQLGASVENQPSADDRLPHLLDTPVALRFASVEPLINEVRLDQVCVPYGDEGDRDSGYNVWNALTGHRSHKAGGYENPDKRLGWVIVGGESGKKARPCEVAWIRKIIQQCKTADVPCFVKQLGADPRITLQQRLPDEESFELAALREREEKLTWPRLTFSHTSAILEHSKGGDPEEWPLEFRVRQFPKV